MRQQNKFNHFDTNIVTFKWKNKYTDSWFKPNDEIEWWRMLLSHDCPVTVSSFTLMKYLTINKVEVTPPINSIWYIISEPEWWDPPMVHNSSTWDHTSRVHGYCTPAGGGHHNSKTQAHQEREDSVVMEEPSNLLHKPQNSFFNWPALGSYWNEVHCM